MITMDLVIIILLSLSILLLIISFFKKDKISELDHQLEQLTMTVMQENYQLKKRMNVLEEELLGGEEDLSLSSNSAPKGLDRKVNSDQIELMQILQNGYTNNEDSNDNLQRILSEIENKGR